MTPELQLAEEGYAVMPAFLDEEQCTAYAAALESEWRKAGAPALFSQEDVGAGEGLHVSPVGLACAGILRRVPSLANLLLRPALLHFFREVLGPGFELELGTGVVSDETREFLAWHHHAGGIDEPDLRRKSYPRTARIERIGCTLYMQPLGEEHGTLLVFPRRADSPTEPPHPPGRRPWPGAREIRAPAGSLVFLDQGTWHAVTPKRTPGRRYFAAFFLRRAGIAATKRSDPSIDAARAASSALAEAYGS